MRSQGTVTNKRQAGFSIAYEAQKVDSLPMLTSPKQLQQKQDWISQYNRILDSTT